RHWSDGPIRAARLNLTSTACAARWPLGRRIDARTTLPASSTRVGAARTDSHGTGDCRLPHRPSARSPVVCDHGQGSHQCDPKHWCERCSSADPPPLKWSDLRYVFDIKEDCNGKEAIQA